jgi:hypothetical protein
MNLFNICLIQLKAGDEPFINQSNQTSKSNYYPYQTQKNGTSSSQYLATSSSHIQNYSYGVNDSLEPFNLRIPVNEINSLGIKPVSARVKMPSGKVANPMVEQNPDGTVSIKYQPSEVGLHELDVFYNGQPIQGSPFKFHVDAINSLTGDQTSSGYVTAYGTGLTHGV